MSSLPHQIMANTDHTSTHRSLISPAEVARVIPGPRMLKTPFVNFLMRVLALDRISALYEQMSASQDSSAFMDELLDRLDIAIDLNGQDLERIPRTGPVVVVANHPFGALEGIILTSVLRRVRSDCKLVANHLLQRVPEIRDRLIFVNPFDTPTSRCRNVAGLRASLAWLESGGLLSVFPSGEVSHVSWDGWRVTDPVWDDVAACLARRSGAPVVPVYFHGCNSWSFQLLGLLHPCLRTAWLARELVNKRGRTIRISVGEQISNRRFQKPSSYREMTEYLRQRVYFLKQRTTLDSDSKASTAALESRVMMPIAPQTETLQLSRDIEALPSDQILVKSGDHLVFHADADQLPYSLGEIGRLRELTFRAAGEGTGRCTDIDRFDMHYKHLFIWNHRRAEIVGAYRLGLMDDSQGAGVDHLYTNTLFKYEPEFFSRIGPAIELGRSFIREEYQRSYGFLLLLWRGISTFLARHPQYGTLFGAVSVSRRYSNASYQLIIDYLRQHHWRPDLSRLIKPRRSLRSPSTAGVFRVARPTISGIRDLDEVSSRISDLEPDRKGMPILMKHYLKIGALAVAFNLDPDFGDSLDVLTVLDVARADDRLLRRLQASEQKTIARNVPCERVDDKSECVVSL